MKKWFLDFSFMLQGHRTVQTAHCALAEDSFNFGLYSGLEHICLPENGLSRETICHNPWINRGKQNIHDYDKLNQLQTCTSAFLFMNDNKEDHFHVIILKLSVCVCVPNFLCTSECFLFPAHFQTKCNSEETSCFVFISLSVSSQLCFVDLPL